VVLPSDDEEAFKVIAALYGLECVMSDGVHVCSDQLPDAPPPLLHEPGGGVGKTWIFEAPAHLALEVMHREGVLNRQGRGLDGFYIATRLGTKRDSNDKFALLTYLIHADIDSSVEPPVVSTELKVAPPRPRPDPWSPDDVCKARVCVIGRVFCPNVKDIEWRGFHDRASSAHEDTVLLSCAGWTSNFPIGGGFRVGKRFTKEPRQEWRIVRASEDAVVLSAEDGSGDEWIIHAGTSQ
jgi:hypothetical protein